MAETTYTVTIAMSADTAAALADAGSMLYAFKAVRCSDRTGLPLVWFVTSRLAPNMVVSWTSPYDGYDSPSPLAAGKRIVPGFQVGLPLGGTLVIRSASGSGDVLLGGTSGTCSILNSTTVEFSVGLAQAPVDAARLPLCAFPLFGGNLATITPLEQVLLMFSTRALAPGTALTSLNMPASQPVFLAVTTGGVLIDMADQSARSVSFERNLGWDWNGAVWGTGVPANANLQPWLIQPDLN
jgi:hypothetical protein